MIKIKDKVDRPKLYEPADDPRVACKLRILTWKNLNRWSNKRIKKDLSLKSRLSQWEIDTKCLQTKIKYLVYKMKYKDSE